MRSKKKKKIDISVISGRCKKFLKYYIFVV